MGAEIAYARNGAQFLARTDRDAVHLGQRRVGGGNPVHQEVVFLERRQQLLAEQWVDQDPESVTPRGKGQPAARTRSARATAQNQTITGDSRPRVARYAAAAGRAPASPSLPRRARRNREHIGGNQRLEESVRL